MAIKIFKMPHLGESVTEASITEWLVKEGDRVERFYPIAEAASDKVTTEIPSDFSGVVKEFLVDLDDDVPIGTPILSIEVEEGGAAAEAEAPVATKEDAADEAEAVEPQAASAPNHQNQPPVEADKDAEGRRYSPAVRKLAREKGIDLSQVDGTGKHGRITRRDVENYVPHPTAPTDQPAFHDQVAHNVYDQAEESGEQAVVSERPWTDSGETRAASQVESREGKEIVKADTVRKAIAKRMTQSVNEIPHAWMAVEMDVSNVVALRQACKEEFKKREGVSLSYFPFFVKAIVQAIKKYPVVNTSWEDGHIVYHRDINTSIAVGTEDQLFVPVIKQADNYSISGLAKEVNRLAKGAREGTLTNDDMSGGTITINNTGVFGSLQSMGIINYPQAVIIQVESINKRIIPTDDNGFKVADMVNICVSLDHRILDGMVIGKFLNDIKENLARFNSEKDLY